MDYSESVLQQLHNKFPNQLRPTIVDVRIVQTQSRVWLETTTEERIGDLVDQTASRMDLGFICDSECSLVFNPSNSVTQNRNLFLNAIDQERLAATTNLFQLEALSKIEHRQVSWDRKQLAWLVIFTMVLFIVSFLLQLPRRNEHPPEVPVTSLLIPAGSRSFGFALSLDSFFV